MSDKTLTVHVDAGQATNKILGFLRWSFETWGAEVDVKDKTDAAGKHYRKFIEDCDVNLKGFKVNLERRIEPEV